MSRKIKNILSKNPIWTFTTYFTEGFPFTITRTVVPMFLRDMKVSLEGIGLTSLYGLPWILKFLWSPQLDETATKRVWLLYTQSIIAVLMLISAIFIPLSFGINAIAIMFFVVACISATHDIAIDGYYMAALDKTEQAKFVGFRVMAYRIAMMTATGLIVTIGAATTWQIAFLSAGVIMSLFFLYHLFFLKEAETYGKTYKQLFSGFLKFKRILGFSLLAFTIIGIRYFLASELYKNLQVSYSFLRPLNFAHWVGILLLLVLIVVAVFSKKIKRLLTKDPDSNYSKAFLAFVDRKGIGVMLSFIILLRVGEWMLSTMQVPFIVDLGIKIHYGWMASFIALPASIVGAMVGGWAIHKYGMKKTIWPFILLQNFTNVLYMLMAFYLSDFIVVNTGVMDPVGIGTSNLVLMSGMLAFDQFSGGLGTAVLMTYLMRICVTEYKATHYAIGSGLMNLGGMFTGVSSGFLAGWLGYAWTFGISFLVSIPGMILIAFLPNYEDKNKD